MRFSERVGSAKTREVLQIGKIDDALRSRLWNFFSLNAFPTKELRHANLTSIADGFLKTPIHWSNPDYESIMGEVTRLFAYADWARVYDCVEFAVDRCSFGSLDKRAVIKGLNQVLAEEMAGYRFVGGVLCQLVDTVEVAEVEKAIKNFRKAEGVRVHISAAMTLMRPAHHDYRNSVKESISAVEAACARFLGEKGTLDDLLKKLSRKIDIHRALQAGFGKLYGWTSDAGGIRHALMDQTTVEVEDARYMLVVCSAFINYLYAKADTAGVQ